MYPAPRIVCSSGVLKPRSIFERRFDRELVARDLHDGLIIGVVIETVVQEPQEALAQELHEQHDL